MSLHSKHTLGHLSSQRLICSSWHFKQLSQPFSLTQVAHCVGSCVLLWGSQESPHASHCLGHSSLHGSCMNACMKESTTSALSLSSLLLSSLLPLSSLPLSS